MKHEGRLEGRELTARDVRTETHHFVRVHCPEGEIDATVLNVSSEGFRLHSSNPLQPGWVVTLDSYDQDPVKALICWACGLDAGGVFAEAVAL